MGGRQSSQSNSNRASGGNVHDRSSVRYSLSSIENLPSSNRSNSLFSEVGNGLEFGVNHGSRAVRRRRGNRSFIETSSLPSHLFPAFLSAEIKCPVCNKRIGSDEIEAHLLVCLSKPRVSYNEDILKSNAGECIICFDDMDEGDHIARLPCLCIYHKKCLDDWFQRNRSCPEHPDQVPTNEFSSADLTSSVAVSSLRNISNSDTPSHSNTHTNMQSNSQSEIIGASAAISITQSQDIASYSHRTPSTHSLSNNEPSTEETTGETSNELTLNRYTGNFEIELGEECTDDDGNIIDATNQTNSQLSPISECSQSSFNIDHENISGSSQASPRRKTVVHVDDGSIHGSPTLFNDEELEQLATKIKTIMVAESPRSNNDSDNTIG